MCALPSFAVKICTAGSGIGPDCSPCAVSNTSIAGTATNPAPGCKSCPSGFTNPFPGWPNCTGGVLWAAAYSTYGHWGIQAVIKRRCGGNGIAWHCFECCDSLPSLVIVHSSYSAPVLTWLIAGTCPSSKIPLCSSGLRLRARAWTTPAARAPSAPPQSPAPRDTCGPCPICTTSIAGTKIHLRPVPHRHHLNRRHQDRPFARLRPLPREQDHLRGGGRKILRWGSGPPVQAAAISQRHPACWPA